MSIVPLVTSAAEEGAAQGINPWFVGAGVLLLLLALLAGLVAFGAGRDHS